MLAHSFDEVIESHYLETVEGLFFAVKGLVHPPDRFLACLRYAPDPTGDRQAGGQRYRRLYHFAEQEALLRVAYPHYLTFDPICQAVLQSVPRSHIRRVYSPYQGLADLRGQQPRSRLAEDCIAFANVLEREAQVPASALGVSGSLLIGLDTPASDLDLTVRGVEPGWAVYRALQRLLDSGADPDLRRLAGQGMQDLYAERAADTRMAFADFLTVERAKVNQGQFQHRPYFLRFVPAPGEIAERYGDYRYTPVGRASITARVADATAGIFTPCTYALAEVVFLDGEPRADLRAIVSFRGRFCEQAQAGDLVQACGMLEKVQTREGDAWHRLLLGNAAEDTMILRDRP